MLRFTIGEEFAGVEGFDLPSLWNQINSKDIDMDGTRLIFTQRQNNEKRIDFGFH